MKSAKGNVDFGSESDGQRMDVAGCSLHKLRLVSESRGNLSVGEFERDVPFVPKRYFLVYDVPEGETRGNHAHKLCHQFLVCVRGSCQLRLDDGHSHQELTLNRPDIGVYLPPMIWEVLHKYSADGTLLVFASEFYDPNDYILSYEQFCELSLRSRPST